MGQAAHQRLKKKLEKKQHLCYVLITCDQPTADGHMQVEMSYEGDASVASYLLQGAQSYIDEQTTESSGCSCCHSKIQPLSP